MREQCCRVFGVELLIQRDKNKKNVAEKDVYSKIKNVMNQRNVNRNVLVLM